MDSDREINVTDEMSEYQIRIGRFPKRLEEAIGNESVRAFARRSGLSDKVIRQYLGGKSEPTRPALIAMADAAGVSLLWLAIEEGPKEKEALKTAFLKLSHKEVDWNLDIDERLFQNVIMLTDESLDSMHYHDTSPDTKAMVYFYLHTIAQKEGRISLTDIVKATSLFIEKSFLLYDFEIAEKIKALVDKRISRNANTTLKNKAYWELIDIVSDMFCDGRVIVPERIKGKIIGWLNEEIDKEAEEESLFPWYNNDQDQTDPG